MRSIVALFLGFATAACLAESIHAYKSVHADGTVSYSDTRPQSASSVQTVEIRQTEEAILDQGEKRKQQMQAIGEQLDDERAEQSKARIEYQSRLAEARKELRDAQRNLDITLESKKNATPERIGLAEERIELARKRLREVEASRP